MDWLRVRVGKHDTSVDVGTWDDLESEGLAPDTAALVRRTLEKGDPRVVTFPTNPSEPVVYYPHPKRQKITIEG